MRKVFHLMGALTNEEAEWLASHGQARFVPGGMTVIEAGRTVEALFVLLDGSLSVRVGDGRDQEVATLYPGEVLGEISFIDARPPSASVVAVRDCHLLVIDRDTLNEKLHGDDRFAAHFYRGLALCLADRLRMTTAHLGYGAWRPDDESAAISEDSFDEISSAARRFDDMLRRLRVAGSGST